MENVEIVTFIISGVLLIVSNCRNYVERESTDIVTLIISGVLINDHVERKVPKYE